MSIFLLTIVKNTLEYICISLEDIMKKAILTKPVAFRISPKEYQIIKKISDEKEISMNELVRDLINKAGEEMQQKQQLAF